MNLKYILAFLHRPLRLWVVLNMRLALICRQNSCGIFHRYNLGYCFVVGNKVNKGHPSCYHWPVFLFRIYRLGEKSPVAEGHELKTGLRWHAPSRKVFEMNMRWDAIWCILKHNFEKCYRVCTDLVASGWFFRYSYLYTVMITIFFGMKAGHFGGGGGSFYPSNTLDRTPQWHAWKLSWSDQGASMNQGK